MQLISEEELSREITFAEIRRWFSTLSLTKKGGKIKPPKGRILANHTNLNIQRFMRFEVEDI